MSEFNNQSSTEYKNMVKDLESEIKKSLTKNGDEMFFVKIIGLK